ncbi:MULTISPECIES: hypothetical protein [unclassified Mesorhizobium]|uniref:hypothetical protein n=1 Tax=unclassified Mesorhizobium TaxID=325217 RepID=UPI00112959C2|nr:MULTISPECIES: hypothetical protein [unclassified Mesorhizobium]MBZ9699531.1 hypothetical protein [Mesorhizobium sp. CO1-1-3]MBZ9945784.1 hypothetical protein [Mesorhizobium sp. BR1-1-11]TPJ08217.1 hypothetical protein FJ428_07880 [Mesorhizobium sp. B2-8-1]
MNDFPKPTQLSTIYTAKEAAGRLKMTQRGVITIGKRYGCCSINGRNALFSEQDLLDIWQIMRAPATATKRVTASAIAFYTSDASYKDLLRTDQRKRDEKRRLRKEREAAERERRLEVKRQASRDKLAARVAKRTAAVEAKAAQHAAADSEPLDVNNRDPAYWKDQRKKRLRLERLARLNGDAE